MSQEEHKHDDKELPVHVKSLKTGEKRNFKMPEDATLEQVWAQANTELGETRGGEDTFRCQGGLDLMGRLNQTLAQLREETVCINRQFEIKGPSGGAGAR
jgi:hypothetical protein